MSARRYAAGEGVAASASRRVGCISTVRDVASRRSVIWMREAQEKKSEERLREGTREYVIDDGAFSRRVTRCSAMARSLLRSIITVDHVPTAMALRRDRYKSNADDVVARC